MLKRELSDERRRGEACGKAADEWRGAAMRADAEVERLNHEQALVRKALAHRILDDLGPDYWRKVLDECDEELGGSEKFKEAK